MLFEVVHVTDYRYGVPAREAYIETRLTPPARPEQDILVHNIDFQPAAGTSSYLDYFGNVTTFYSMTLRHERLVVTNRMTVRTRPRAIPEEILAMSVAETRQIFSSALTDIFDFLQPTSAVPVGGAATEWAQKFFRGDVPLAVAFENLNHAIYERFEYKPGATELNTPLPAVWKSRAGVCQDFAHIMLSVLRTAGMPARYVCGYIESQPPASLDTSGKQLVGSLATHAWVEIMVPGQRWVALDPTNNQWSGERHVTVSLGRDFSDAAPVRGRFKGSGSQAMKVHVTMKRLTDNP